MLESCAVSPVPEPQLLAIHRWPCQGTPCQGQPLVLLHGWGSDSCIWGELAQLLAENFDLVAVDLPGFGDSTAGEVNLDALLWQLARQLPDKMVLVGWSLGGMVATAFAHSFPRRVTHLVTLATNASFVQRPNWPTAMPGPLFRQFSDSFEKSPANCLQRFASLQVQGDHRARQVHKSLRQQRPAVDRIAWQAALAMLAEIDNRALVSALSPPALFLFGEQDALVPAAAADQVRRLQGDTGSARIDILPGVAHVPHLSDPCLVAERIFRFLQEDPYRLEKKQVAAAFGKAAATYDSAARLQRNTGKRLLKRLAEIPQKPARIADLGCGTGLFTGLLQRHYPQATCIGLDLSEAMLRHCQSVRSGAGGSAEENKAEQQLCRWLCGDAEQLPFAAKSLDLVFSNFTFQWCQQLGNLFSEIDRVLAPGGALVFSTIGPDSLRELRAAWQAVDGYTHVNRFVSPEAVSQHLRDQDFRIEVFAETEVVHYYAELGDLTRELKALGAHNVNAGRNIGLTGRRRIVQFRQAYEQFRTPLGLPASWQILQVVAFRG